MGIKYTEKGDIIDGEDPIVIIGPNGSGKTKYGVQLAKWNTAEFISAQRRIDVGTAIPMHNSREVAFELQRFSEDRLNTPWSTSNEIDLLFSKLIEQDRSSAVVYRDNSFNNQNKIPEETKLMQLRSIWHKLFPGRQISFDDYMPRTKSVYANQKNLYPAQQMSDGERVALYLAGRVLDSDKNVIIIDEPEIHFHNRLAIQFWNEMERAKENCVFIYITHDLMFAKSRLTKRFFLLRKEKIPGFIELSKDIPEDVAVSLLSAASFSINANVIIFCEGTESSLDQRLFKALFRSQDVVVIPVSSCRDVIRCVTTFQKYDFVSNLNCYGFIDSDYWPEKFLRSLPNNVYVLPVHEVESIFCHKQIFSAVAEYHGKNPSECDTLYDSFLNDAQKQFVGETFLKQVSERFKNRCEEQVRFVVSSFPAKGTKSEIEVNLRNAFSSDKWKLSPEEIFQEEWLLLDNALQTKFDLFLKYFPGKMYINLLTKQIGIEKKAYVDLIIKSLESSNGSDLKKLGDRMRSILKELISCEELFRLVEN